VAGCCECGDEPSGSRATELVSYGNEIEGSPCHFIVRFLETVR
jgi:hypothetical protein